MKTLQMLLGCSERRTGAIIEATVLDVCFNRAAVKTTKVLRLSEFTRWASCGGAELMILVANHLLPDPRLGEVTQEQLVQSIWLAKNRSSAPLIVMGAPSPHEHRFVEAGADATVSSMLNLDKLRAELNRVLDLPAPEEELEPEPRWSLTSLFGRGK